MSFDDYLKMAYKYRKNKIQAPEVNLNAQEKVFDKMYITDVEKRLRT